MKWITEKRFDYGAGVNWQEDVIIDYETEKSYNFYEVGKLLNELAEKNKLHKERILLLSSLLDLADAIIDTSDNEKAKQVWDNKNEQTEKEWERILDE